MDQYCIGSDRVPGLSKLIEECGEVAQVAGKVIGLGSLGDHWDGTNLKRRLEDEIADVIAAADHVIEFNDLDAHRIRVRIEEKRDRFRTWAQGGPEPGQPVSLK